MHLAGIKNFRYVLLFLIFKQYYEFGIIIPTLQIKYVFPEGLKATQLLRDKI